MTSCITWSSASHAMPLSALSAAVAMPSIFIPREQPASWLSYVRGRTDRPLLNITIGARPALQRPTACGVHLLSLVSTTALSPACSAPIEHPLDSVRKRLGSRHPVAPQPRTHSNL